MPRPILIDLYFTLIEPDPRQEWFHHSAALLNIPPATLRDASLSSFDDRMNGAIRTPDEVIDRALAELKRTVDPAVREQLIQYRWQFFHGLHVYPDVLPALEMLRQRGHQLGIVSNCSAETTVVFDKLGLSHLFDVLALSCDVRAVKPEPAIYQYAIDALGVAPQQIVYVGDGDTDEHAGAARFGMTTVLLSRSNSPKRHVTADYTISSLSELLTLPALNQASQ